MRKPQKIDHENLFQFVKVVNNTLKINFDGLCQYLFKYEHRQFLVTDFEKILNNELSTKLVGQPINATTLKNVCNYIDELSLYLTAKYNAVSSGNITNSSKEFYRKHKNVYDSKLEKLRKTNPAEYAALKARLDQRSNNA